jgi:hypothetical protein
MHEAAAEPQLVSLVPVWHRPLLSQQPSHVLTLQRGICLAPPQAAVAAMNPMTEPNTRALNDEDEKNDIVLTPVGAPSRTRAPTTAFEGSVSYTSLLV